MKGVILAAGKGTRLYPATHIIAKPLLPMANRPTLHYAFDRLKEIGITDICIVVGPTNEEQMRAALGDGSEFGIRLTYVRQDDPKGLAHAVGFAQEFVGDDSFVLYLGDAIYETGFDAHARKFLESGAANLNIVKPVEDPRRFGVANVEGDRIVKLVEKPQNPESNLAMAGLYFFGPELWTVLPDLEPSARGEYEITDAIQMLIDRGHLVLAGIYEDTWFDTGTLDSFLETTAFLTKGDSLFGNDTKVEAKVGEKVVIGDGARVKCGSIEDSVILPGADVEVEGDIRRALLGGTIRSDASIESQILHGDWKG
jgi:glucose-1-phosphate thymidylyltransferase